MHYREQRRQSQQLLRPIVTERNRKPVACSSLLSVQQKKVSSRELVWCMQHNFKVFGHSHELGLSFFGPCESSFDYWCKACMFVCVCMCMCVSVCVCAHARACVCVCVRARAHARTCVCLCVYSYCILLMLCINVLLKPKKKSILFVYIHI